MTAPDVGAGSGVADVTLSSTITITPRVAIYLADLIDLTRRLLARQNGCPLGDYGDAIERSLRECSRFRSPTANGSAEVAATHDLLPSTRELMTVKEAAAQLKPITERGVRWLCEKRGLGRKVGNRWLIDRLELEVFEQSRKGTT